MKSLLVLSTLVAGFFLASPGPSAQEEPFEVYYLDEERVSSDGREASDPQEIPRLHSSESSRGKLFDQWFLYRVSRTPAEGGGKDPPFREVVSTFRREGLKAESYVAGAFAHDGFRALQAGDPGRARDLFRKALVLDPHMGPAKVGISRALRQEGGGLWEAFLWRIRGTPILSGDWRALAALLANVSLVVWIGLWIGWPVVVLLLFIRQQGRWRHDVREFLPLRSSSELAGLLAWGVLALPVFLWFGPVWLFAYWLAGLFPYFQKSERILALAGLLALILAYPSLGLLRGFAAYWSDPRVEEILSFSEGGFSRESVEAVNRILDENPASLGLQALLAQAYSDGGFSNEAYGQYRRILERDPDSAWIYNNLGNLYLRSQQYGQAIQKYRRAIEADPDLVEPYYNLHLAYMEQFLLEEAEESLRKAQRRDPDRVSALVDRGKREPWMSGTVLPVDVRLPMGRLVAETLELKPWRRAGRRDGPLVAWDHPATIAGWLGLVGLAAGGILRKKRVARKCPKCGRHYCYRCQQGVVQKLCSQCHHMLLQKESLSTPIRAAKLQGIARFEARERRVRRTLSLLLPGGGHIYGGRTLWGVFFLGVWILAWTAIGSHRIQFPEPEVPFVLSHSLGGILTAVSLVGVWFLANLVPSVRES